MRTTDQVGSFLVSLQWQIVYLLNCNRNQIMAYLCSCLSSWTCQKERLRASLVFHSLEPKIYRSLFQISKIELENLCFSHQLDAVSFIWYFDRNLRLSNPVSWSIGGSSCNDGFFNRKKSHDNVAQGNKQRQRRANRPSSRDLETFVNRDLVCDFQCFDGSRAPLKEHGEENHRYTIGLCTSFLYRNKHSRMQEKLMWPEEILVRALANQYTTEVFSKRSTQEVTSKLYYPTILP